MKNERLFITAGLSLAAISALALALGLITAGPVVAQSSSNSPSNSDFTTPIKPEIYRLTPARTIGTTNEMGQVGGFSVRAWTTTVGWHPGVSAFPDADTYHFQLDLFGIGHEPKE